MEHYAITLLKAEKSRLEYELFEKQKFNDSYLADKMTIELKKTVHYLPQQLESVKTKIKELDQAISHLTKNTKIG